MNERISFRTSLAMILILAGFAFVACKQSGNVQTGTRTEVLPSASSPVLPTDGARRVTVSELKDALEKGEAIVLDVRGEVEYKLGHIKDACSIPLGLISGQAKDLPRDKLIVTYCA